MTKKESFCKVDCKFKDEIKSTQFGGLFSYCNKMNESLFVAPISKKKNVTYGECIAIKDCGELVDELEIVEF